MVVPQFVHKWQVPFLIKDRLPQFVQGVASDDVPICGWNSDLEAAAIFTLAAGFVSVATSMAAFNSAFFVSSS